MARAIARVSVAKAIPLAPVGSSAGGTVQRSYHVKTNLSKAKPGPALSMGPSPTIRTKIPPMSGPYIKA